DTVKVLAWGSQADHGYTRCQLAAGLRQSPDAAAQRGGQEEVALRRVCGARRNVTQVGHPRVGQAAPKLFPLNDVGNADPVAHGRLVHGVEGELHHTVRIELRQIDGRDLTDDITVAARVLNEVSHVDGLHAKLTVNERDGEVAGAANPAALKRKLH